MSHDIEVLRSGQVSFFSAREPAWHRLGTVTPGALSATEALATARLGDWNVVKRPVFTTSPDGDVIQIKDKYATVRRNPDPGSTESDALGIVGGDYEVIQNEEAFSFLTALVEHGDAVFETAGSLRGGTRVFVTMKIPEPMKIADNEELDLYVAVATGHDGLFAFSAFPTPVRVVCQNTLSLALSGNKRVQKVRHATGAAPRLAEARAMLALTITEGEAIRHAAKLMLDIRISNQSFDDIVATQFVQIDGHTPKKTMEIRTQQRDDLRSLFRDSPTQEVGRGTAWGAFNAVSEWSEWVKPKNPWTPGNAESVLNGRSSAIRQQAFKAFGPPEMAATR